ncbi:MAG TPA: type II toxin-antitoxin system VapC family toxin [Pyrinomonadaceae bacterium]|nr:type II toxin-antitoxin system VapC family toxin [Acidobacteriota bacterium]HQZ95610.1 type II toxin-antitoxin system VapC family toxin [Pyrinomonadaceae bacterium]
MRRILTDTNVLLRNLQPDHHAHVLAANALVTLSKEYDEICVLPQNLIEFWNVSTRPLEQNGFGWTSIVAEIEVARYETIFTLLPDTQAIYAEWRSIVRDNSVLGKQVHDARIAAAMSVHQITKLLTFNGKDFKRFGFIEVIDPQSILVSDEQNVSE